MLFGFWLWWPDFILLIGRTKNEKYLQIICGLILCCTMLLTGCGQSGGQSSDTAATNSKAEAKGQLTISMLDIGQGDAVLIQTGAKIFSLTPVMINTMRMAKGQGKHSAVVRVAEAEN